MKARPIAARYNSAVTDHQGNVVRTSKANGEIVQSADYYPEGEPWEEPSAKNPYLFGGKERVTLGGLKMDDFGARLYNSAIATWMQPDPMCEHTPHISPYTYCNGNSVMFTDPTGRSAESANDSLNMISKKNGIEILEIPGTTISETTKHFLEEDRRSTSNLGTSRSLSLSDAGIISGVISIPMTSTGYRFETAAKSVSNSTLKGSRLVSNTLGKEVGMVYKTITGIGKGATAVSVASSLGRFRDEVEQNGRVLVPMLRFGVDLAMTAVAATGPLGLTISTGYFLFDVAYGDEAWKWIDNNLKYEF